GILHGDHVGGRRVAHSQDLRIVIGLHGLQQVGLAVLSAGGQCGDVVGKLEGRVELVGLAEGGPGGLVVARLIAGQGTGVITNLNAGVLSQAEGLQILPEGVHAHSVSHLREEVVAGLGDGLRHIDETVVAAGAVGAAVGGVVGIDPPAGRVDLLGGSNDPLLQ
ncbi:RNA polymerase sigma factor sigV, partial [Dysosmobacter welbionis]